MWTTIKTTNIRYGNYDEDKHQKENQFTWRASPSLQAGWLGNRRTANQYGKPSAKDNHQTNSPGASPSLQAWGNCCCIGVQLSIGVASPGVHNGRPETYFYILFLGTLLDLSWHIFFLGCWSCTCRWSCGHGCRQGWLWRQDGWGGGRWIFWYGYWSKVLLPIFWYGFWSKVVKNFTGYWSSHLIRELDSSCTVCDIVSFCKNIVSNAMSPCQQFCQSLVLPPISHCKISWK